MNFNELTLIQKIKTIQEKIDTDIKPVLAMDGGSLDLVEVKETDDFIEVSIRYLGACSGCGGAIGTLFAIENQLQHELSDKIKVISI